MRLRVGEVDRRIREYGHSGRRVRSSTEDATGVLIYYTASPSLDLGGQMTGSPIAIRTFLERGCLPVLNLRVVGYYLESASE